MYIIKDHLQVEYRMGTYVSLVFTKNNRQNVAA